MIFATRLLEGERTYTGPELRPHFLLSEMGLKGNALGAFIGPCEVKTDKLVDWEDRLANDFIRAKSMVHFIGEFFGMGMREGVFVQRLLMATMAQKIQEANPGLGLIRRTGDDLYLGEGASARKLSVSIVTASPVSLLLHAGVNIDSSGAPVQAAGLIELGVEPKAWAQAVLSTFAEEWESVEWACAKVRPVV